MYLPLALYQLWNAAKFQLFTRICVDNPCRLFVYLARLDTSIELDEITVFADLIYNCYSCKLKLKRLGKKTFLLTINLSYLGFRILDTAAPNKSKATQRILGIQKEVTNADTTQVLNWTAGAVWKLLQSSKSEDWWGSSARIFVDIIKFYQKSIFTNRRHPDTVLTTLRSLTTRPGHVTPDRSCTFKCRLPTFPT